MVAIPPDVIAEPEPEPLQFISSPASTTTAARLPITNKRGKDINLTRNILVMVSLHRNGGEGLKTPRGGKGRSERNSSAPNRQRQGESSIMERMFTGI